MIDPGSLRRVLVVRLTSLGDVVRITGVLDSLRAALPGAEIAAATSLGNAPLLTTHPAVDRLVLAKRSARQRLSFAWEAWRRLAPLRRDGGIDLTLDLHGTRAAAVWSWASRGRMKARRGEAGRGWLATLAPDMAVEDSAESYALLRTLGLDLAPRPPCLRVDPAEDAAVAAQLARRGLPGRGYILVSPFSRWTAKDWPEAHYARLLPALAEASGRPVVLSGGREAAAVQALAGLQALLPHPLPAFNGDLKVGGLMALVARAGLVISGDSGPMHMAAALGRPQVALFGATHPERSGPWGWGAPDGKVRLLQRVRAGRHHDYLDDANRAALAAIPPDAVLEASLDLLRRFPEPLA